MIHEFRVLDIRELRGRQKGTGVLILSRRIAGRTYVFIGVGLDWPHQVRKRIWETKGRIYGQYVYMVRKSRRTYVFKDSTMYFLNGDIRKFVGRRPFEVHGIKVKE